MDELPELIDKLQVSVRTLDFSGTNTLLDSIDSLLGKNILPMKYSNQICTFVLPLFYPSDENSSKLRFTIQCIIASKLVKWAPSARIEILYAVLSIYEKYNIAFIGNTYIKQTAIDLLNSSRNIWELFTEASKDFNGDVLWSFIIFASNSSAALDKENYSLLSKMLQNKVTFYCSCTDDILTLLCYTSKNWGPNPSFATSFYELSIKHIDLRLGVSIPRFISDDLAFPQTKPEKVIYIVSSHLTESNSQTSRALSTIV